MQNIIKGHVVEKKSNAKIILTMARCSNYGRKRSGAQQILVSHLILGIGNTHQGNRPSASHWVLISQVPAHPSALSSVTLSLEPCKSHVGIRVSPWGRARRKLQGWRRLMFLPHSFLFWGALPQQCFFTRGTGPPFRSCWFRFFPKPALGTLSHTLMVWTKALPSNTPPPNSEFPWGPLLYHLSFNTCDPFPWSPNPRGRSCFLQLLPP